MDDDEASACVDLAQSGIRGWPMRAGVAAVVLAVTMQTALAQDPAPPGMDLATAASRRFPQPVPAGSLIGRTVLQPVESKTVLGWIEQVVRAHGGQVQLVLAYGGWFGIGARTIAVPVDAMALLGRDIEILDFTPKQLSGFPAFDRSSTDPIAPDETIRVGLARPSH